MNLSNTLLRQFNPRKRHPGNVVLLTNGRFYGKYRGYGRKIGTWFREHSIEVARSCTRQLEFIAAQRIRRGLQLFQLYTRIWDEVALKEFLNAWRRKLRRNAKDFLLSSVGVATFSWDKDRIGNDELYSYANEIDTIHQLRDATVICAKCHKRLIIDKEQPDVKYCVCHGKHGFATIGDEAEWQPFIERRDMLIWRREEENTGLYAYKVLGTFSDVSADEFLRVQVDVDYRKEWDHTAKRLEIIDSDPESVSTESQRSDVIYWEMIWPRLFSNRDYVYQRRWVVDKDKGIVVIVSRATDHPNAPNRPDTYRVTSYWSYMVIKPCRDFNEPGIEFSLTYFDDPGINIPYAVSAWVAMSGLPDFLDRMRQAAKGYKDYIAKKQETLEVPLPEDTPREVKGEILLSTDTIEAAKEAAPRQIELAIGEKKEKEEALLLDSVQKINDVDNDDVEIEDSDRDEHHVGKEHSYLRYFFLTRLFA